MRNDLRWSWGDGAAFGGMVGFGETYLPAFALAMGLGELTAGLVGSVPLLAGGIMQLISPLAIRRLRSHKRWVVLCAGLQAATFLPLLFAACMGSITAPMILLIAALYWAAGLSTGPAWNTWIGTLIPPYIRSRFFAVRTRASQAMVFFGFLAGGLGLQYARGVNHELWAFACLFGVACLCRVISVTMLGLQSEPVPIPPKMRHIPWSKLLPQLRHQRGGRLLMYLVAVQAGVQIAGPYFTPFMFKQLHFNYADFVLLIAVAFLTKVLALPLCGRLAKKIGAWRLLLAGGIGIAPVAMGWVFSQAYWWLMVLQITGGVAWAAYELAFFLLFFESIAEEDRTNMLTLYNLLNTVAWVLGSLIGGTILFTMEVSYSSYLLIFALSTVGRSLALLLLVKLPAETPRHVQEEPADVQLRTLAVRPNQATLDNPVLPTLPAAAAELSTPEAADSAVDIPVLGQKIPKTESVPGQQPKTGVRS